MPKLVVMDRTGDSSFKFDTNNAQEVAEAEKRFMELTGSGFLASAPTGNGNHEQVRSFDANREETVFHPAIKGG